MNNTMPVLTDEQRVELEKYITDCLEQRCQIMHIKDMLRLDRLRNQIALAALTAEVGLGVRVIQKNERLKGFDFDGYESLTAGHHHFYTAPPVPALKLPGEGCLESTSEKPLLDWQDGWDACLATVKRLNGVTK